MNSCKQIYIYIFSNYYNLQSVHFEMLASEGPCTKHRSLSLKTAEFGSAVEHLYQLQGNWH